MKTHRLADNVYTYTIGVPLTFIGLAVKTVSKFSDLLIKEKIVLF